MRSGNPHPKPGPGRPKGSKNKLPSPLDSTTEFIKNIAQRYGPECVHALIKLVRNPKVLARDKITCAELILAYGYGKPTQRNEFSGPDGGSIPISLEKLDGLLMRTLEEITAASYGGDAVQGTPYFVPQASPDVPCLPAGCEQDRDFSAVGAAEITPAAPEKEA